MKKKFPEKIILQHLKNEHVCDGDYEHAVKLLYNKRQ